MTFVYLDQMDNSLFLVDVKDATYRQIERHMFSREEYVINNHVRNDQNLFFIKLDVSILLIMNEIDTSLVDQECEHCYPNKLVI